MAHAHSHSLQVPSELSPEEARIAAKLHRIGTFYVFLREVRAELFDETFQAQLAAGYQPRGTAPPTLIVGLNSVTMANNSRGKRAVPRGWYTAANCA